MARKKAHEEHANHEAWAIPYGDLLTLLLALFVVLYSMSSVNEGKYRVLSDSLNEAFGGRPRSPLPIQIGDHAPKSSSQSRYISVIPRRASADDLSGVRDASQTRSPGIDFGVIRSMRPPLPGTGSGDETGNLARMAAGVRQAMGDLIAKNMVVVRQSQHALEIEIRTDILFPSGVAQISAGAQPVLARLAEIVKPFPNFIRIEGHTDNVPISTTAFPSNWQLSAARAASVVSLFIVQGVEPARMSVAGFAEFHPVADNATEEHRKLNRRVKIVVLSAENASAAGYGEGGEVPPAAGSEAGPEPAGASPAPVPAAGGPSGEAPASPAHTLISPGPFAATPPT